jgi:hypothetical protein
LLLDIYEFLLSNKLLHDCLGICSVVSEVACSRLFVMGQEGSPFCYTITPFVLLLLNLAAGFGFGRDVAG